MDVRKFGGFLILIAGLLLLGGIVRVMVWSLNVQDAKHANQQSVDAYQSRITRDALYEAQNFPNLATYLLIAGAVCGVLGVGLRVSAKA